jgi:hypothetical protein
MAEGDRRLPTTARIAVQRLLQLNRTTAVPTDAPRPLMAAAPTAVRRLLTVEALMDAVRHHMVAEHLRVARHRIAVVAVADRPVAVLTAVAAPPAGPPEAADTPQPPATVPAVEAAARIAAAAAAITDITRLDFHDGKTRRLRAAFFLSSMTLIPRRCEVGCVELRTFNSRRQLRWRLKLARIFPRQGRAHEFHPDRQGCSRAGFLCA